ncbi:NAD(P)-dependent oxidoreductase [Nocardioides sp. YIM 152588]|uniref:NAD(P)-dependent oxidoreductase n=1 Tax=Nocardioides sp. YIM 152588 TaxID=3158259 RepID=UPI0032E396AE
MDSPLSEESRRPTVAVLGTGIMGAAMARNLVRSGLPVRVWNRSPAKAEPLAADGAVVAASPTEAVDGADVVLTMLYDGASVLAAMRRAAPGLRPGQLWMQSTTVGVAEIGPLAAFAAEHGLALYDAPVSGTREPAEAGQLLVIAAGPTAQRPRLAPVLDAVAARVVWTGDDGGAGTSTRLKLVVNSWVLAANNAAGELVALARALGVDPQQFFDLVAGGGLDLPYLRMKAALLVDGRTMPASFAVATAAKDARLIVAAAAAQGVRLDGVEAAGARLERAVAAGLGEEDMAAAYTASFEELRSGDGDLPKSG